MEERRSALIKLHAAQRYVVWHYLQPLFNNVRVLEFPKSGGTWLSQMIAELFGIPYPRNAGLPLEKSLQHEHYISQLNYKTTVLVRDGRDVMTSAYFHFLIVDHKRPKHLLTKWRDLMNIDYYEDVKKGMPRFIKTFSEHLKIGGRNANWSQHVMRANESDKALVIKYEDLLKDAASELEKICVWYNAEPKIPIKKVVDKFSFRTLTQRSSGEEDRQSFLRKGIAGDWKNYFNEEAVEAFNELHGEALQYYGYD